MQLDLFNGGILLMIFVLFQGLNSPVLTTNALVNFMPHRSTPGRPHAPGGDLTLLLVPTPGAIDRCPIH